MSNGGFGGGGQADEGLPEAMEAEEELIQGRPTALYPCGARHPLRGFLSKTPTSLRCFSISSGRKMVSMRRMVPWQHGHFRGSAPQMRRMRSRHKGRVARAVALGGAGWTATSDFSGAGFSGGGGMSSAAGEAAGFVGVKAVVTDYLLAFVPFNGTGNLIIHPPGRTRSAPPWMPMTDSSMSRTTFLSCTPHAGGSCGREITVSG